MEEGKKQKLGEIKKWAASIVTAFEKPVDAGLARELDRFTDFLKSLIDEYTGYQVKVSSMARKAKDIRPDLERKIKEFEPELQGIIVILGELVKFLTFFRHKISKGTESGKVRAFLQAVGAKHEELKERGGAVISMINEICPSEEESGCTEEDSNPAEKESDPTTE